MEFRRIDRERKDDPARLFNSTFSLSEGTDEGALIGELVAKSSAGIDDLDIRCSGAVENEALSEPSSSRDCTSPTKPRSVCSLQWRSLPSTRGPASVRR